MHDLASDVRYALRLLRKNPGFTLIAVLTLALGVGANTALFSVVNAVLLRSMPYPHRENLTSFRGGHSWPDLYDIQQQARSVEKIGAFSSWQFDLVGKGEPRLVDAALVSLDLFPALGVQAQMGRVLTSADDLINGPRVIVVSDRFWRNQLGGRGDVVGSALSLTGNTYTVVGVMPGNFRLPAGDADIFVPFRVGYPEAAPYRGVHMHSAVLRLRESATPPQTQGELDSIAKVLAQQHPEENRDRRFVLLSLQQKFIGDTRPAVLMLFAATGVVLLIASANFANLLLSRSVRRRQEIAVRMALGASRLRLARQLLSESSLLALLGGAAGLLLAYWGVHALSALKPKNLASIPPFAIDGSVLGFALLVSVLTGCLFGLLPALELDLGADGSLARERSATQGRFSSRARQALIVGELALSLVLLCGSGLLLRSLSQVQNVNPGFNGNGLLTGHVWLQTSKYPTGKEQNPFFAQLDQNLKNIPGVESAALVSELPLSGNFISHNVVIEGKPTGPVGSEPDAGTDLISSDYFRTFQIPVLAGRAFTDADREGAPWVTIINQTMARQFFPGEDPLGKRVRFARGKNLPWMTIVGMVADTKDLGLDEETAPMLYEPMLQRQEDWRRYATIVLRSRTQDPFSLAPEMKRAVWQLESDLPVTSIFLESQLLESSTGPRRLNTILLAVFAGTALLLAVIGLYGVISYATAQRTREIGVRIALGATRENVIGLVFRDGLRLALLGVAIGSVAALFAARLISSMLFQVKPFDVFTFATGPTVLILTALAATLVPARRAAGVDPVIALRHEQ
jgi:putative ABC transport system permease protein